MRVCHVINYLQDGGAERMILELVRNTTDSRISYTVCTLTGEGTLHDQFRSAGASVVSLGYGSHCDPRAIVGLRAYLSAESFDIVHSHLMPSTVFARLAAAAGGTETLVSTIHNTEFWGPSVRYAELFTRPLATGSIAVSEGVKRASEHVLTTDDISVIPNGIDVEKFRSNVVAADTASIRAKWDVDGGPILLNVGRYVPQKSQADAIRAMPRILDTHPEAQLIVVGHGELKDEIKELARTLGVGESVTVTGHVDSIHGYYALADIFVFPSTHEGLPMTLLEAMAAGLPVVATDIPGVNEVVIDGVTGELVPVGNPTLLADGVTNTVTESSRERYGERGYDRVKAEFSLNSVVSSYCSIYDRLSTDE